MAREAVRLDAEELGKRDGVLQASDQSGGRARQSAADLTSAFQGATLAPRPPWWTYRYSERRRVTSGARSSIVARDPLDPLVLLLRFERHDRDRPGFEAAERDGLAGHFAIAIFAFVEAADRAIDLSDELALAVTGAKLDSPVGFAR